MKQNFNLFIAILGLMLAISACSDDFLKPGNTEVHQLDTIYISPNSQSYSGSLSLPIDVSESYTIQVQPSCMTFSSQKGTFTHGTTTLEFSTDMSDYSGRTGYIGQQLVLYVESVGSLVFIVKIGAPYIPGETEDEPVLQVSTATVDLKTDDSQVLTLNNSGTGNLSYQFNDIPAWLGISDVQGVLSQGQSKAITLTINRNNLDEKEYTAIVQIQNNSVYGSFGLMVKMQVAGPPTKPEYSKPIEGTVTDAEFNKITNQLLVCTQIPNQLIIFNTNDNTQTIIPLDKSPNCLSIAEDGKTAVIGYNLAAVSQVDLESKSIRKTVDTDCIPFDIVLGDNNWCYLMPETGNFEYLRSLNLETSQLVKSTKYGYIYAKMTIRKVPGKPYLLGSNIQVSSNGLIMADISKGIAKDTMPYWFIDTYNFWLSPKGDKIFTGVKNIHRTPTYSTKETYFYNLDIIGTLKPQKENIVWIDPCEATNSIFITETSRAYEYEEYSVIEQLDAGNYNFRRLIKPGSYVTKIDGTQGAYKTLVKFAFSNSSGTQLYAVKNVLNIYKTQAWSMEVIPLN